METGNVEVLISIFKVSLAQSFLSSFSCLVFGILLGSFIFYYKILSIEPFLRGTFYLPTLVVVYLTLYWLKGTSIHYGLWAVVFAHVVLNGFWFGSVCGNALETIPFKDLENARSLGAFFWRRHFDFTLPHLFRLLTPPFILIFSLCFNSFSVVMLLGGGPPIQTFETEIYAGLRMSAGGMNSILPFLMIQAVMGFLYVFLLKGNRFHFSQSRDLNLNKKISLIKDPKNSWGKELLFIFIFWSFFIFPYFPKRQSLKNGFLLLIKNETFFDSFWMSTQIGFGTSVLLTIFIFLLLRGAKISKGFFHLSNFLGAFSPLFLSALFTFGEISFSKLIFLSALIQFSYQYKMAYSFKQNEVFKEFYLARVLGANTRRAFMDHLFPRWKWFMSSLFLSIFFFAFAESTVGFLIKSHSSVPFSVWLSRSESRYSFDEANASHFLLFLFWFLFIGLQRYFFSKMGSPHARRQTS